MAWIASSRRRTRAWLPPGTSVRSEYLGTSSWIYAPAISPTTLLPLSGRPTQPTLNGTLSRVAGGSQWASGIGAKQSSYSEWSNNLIGYSGLPLSTGDNVTFVAVVKWGGANTGSFYGESLVSEYPRYLAALRVNTGANGQVQFLSSNSNASNFTDENNTVLESGVLSTIVCSRTAGSLPVWAINGKRYTSSAWAYGLVPGWSTGNSYLHVVAPGNGASTPDLELYGLFRTNVVVSASEAAALSEDQGRLFSPAKRRSYFLPPAAPSTGRWISSTRRSTRQPTGPVVGVDWSHPLARGLAALYVCNPPLPNDLAYRVGPQLDTGIGSITTAITPDGHGWNTTAGFRRASISTSFANFPLSLGVACVPYATTSDGSAFGYCYGTHWWLAVLYPTSGVWRFDWRTHGDGSYETDSFGFDLEVGKRNVFAISRADRFNGTATLGAYNGRTATAAATSGATTATPDWNGLYFGGLTYSNTNYPFNGAMLLGAAWNRALSLGELADWTADPWQLFQRQQRRIFLPSASTPLVRYFLVT